MDEGSLAANVIGRPIFDLGGPIERDQLAPPGYLALERALAAALGGSGYALRLYSLICGLAALWLFRALALAWLAPRAAASAIALFALSDEQIYYSSEFKPYIGDTFFAVAALFLARAGGATSWTARRAAGAAAFGAIATWFSFPSAFALAGVGSYWMISALRGRRWREAGLVAGIGAAWLLSFAASYSIARGLLTAGTGMWVFWDFAFLPLPPASLGEAGSLLARLANLFRHPARLDTPLGTPASAILGACLCALGCLALARDRRQWGKLWALAFPALLALLAASRWVRLYPFHGRLLLFLAPALWLLAGKGLGLILDRIPSARARALLLILLFLSPALNACRLVAIPYDRGFDPHGDLHSAIFDPAGPRRE